MIAWSLAISSNVDEHVLTYAQPLLDPFRVWNGPGVLILVCGGRHVLEEVQRRGLQSFQNREINAIVLALNNVRAPCFLCTGFTL